MNLEVDTTTKEAAEVKKANTCRYPGLSYRAFECSSPVKSHIVIAIEWIVAELNCFGDLCDKIDRIQVYRRSRRVSFKNQKWQYHQGYWQMHLMALNSSGIIAIALQDTI
ncbi:hypothetical protein QE152_g29714 [Popillia japonica]|uniref:Uncharacterized protein n=1 Tax=Popillia japonica TaxID=7064 RepID=A0AAW1JGE3_POPJA